MLPLLLAAVLVLPAQDAPAPAPAPSAATPAAATQPDVAALQKEFEALQSEFEKAQSDFWASLPQDKDGVITASEEQWAKNPEAEYGKRFVEFARRAGATEPGGRALKLALQMTEGDVQAEVLEQLLDGFLDSPVLEDCLRNVGWMRMSRGTAFAAATLRGVRERTKNRAVKAAATFELAQVLDDNVFDAAVGGMPHTTKSGDHEQARALFVEVRDEFADTPYAARAAGFLFELDHLQVGMVAPDIEAKDQDGVAFKLSDYRGKVVLLDFWGFW